MDDKIITRLIYLLAAIWVALFALVAVSVWLG